MLIEEVNLLKRNIAKKSQSEKNEGNLLFNK